MPFPLIHGHSASLMTISIGLQAETMYLTFHELVCQLMVMLVVLVVLVVVVVVVVLVTVTGLTVLLVNVPSLSTTV